MRTEPSRVLHNGGLLGLIAVFVVSLVVAAGSALRGGEQTAVDESLSPGADADVPADVTIQSDLAARVGGPCEASPPRPEVMTSELWDDVESAIKVNEQILADSGWAFATGPSLVDETEWICGWVQPLPFTMENAAEVEAEGVRPKPIYDRPDGEIIAWGYGTAGAVPVDTPPAFDVDEAVLERNGCPELVASACQPDPDEGPSGPQP